MTTTATDQPALRLPKEKVVLPLSAMEGHLLTFDST